jgi:hypothetical protein
MFLFLPILITTIILNRSKQMMGYNSSVGHYGFLHDSYRSKILSSLLNFLARSLY